MTDPGNYLTWITTRAAGSAALLLSSLSVCVGLLIGARILRRRGSAVDLRALHETLSLATLGAIGLHGATLLVDGYFKPGLAGIAIPFAGSYRPFFTGVGIVAGYALAGLGLSYYLRDRIGAARWRRLHRFTALAWLLGVAHSLGSGTDAGRLWFLAMVALAVVPVLVLLPSRLAAAGGRATPAAQPD